MSLLVPDKVRDLYRMLRYIMPKREKLNYAFIDAANLFYGGERSLGWKMDYQKLFNYLKNKFQVSKVFYYAGLDTENYKPEEGKHINLDDLITFLEGRLKDDDATDAQVVLLERYIQRAKFYKELADFGYTLRIKPVKVFENDEVTIRKANCDVDLTFDLMRYMSQYSGLVVLSGDGDFAPILEYLKKKKKTITILARSNRTAKEIRELAGDKFVDFIRLKEQLRVDKDKKVPTNPTKIDAVATR